MSSKLQQVGLVVLGAALGIAASLHLSAIADRQAAVVQLPVDDLRLFSEVFGRIKNDYVEPVEDKKLLKEAINGMLTGLDPHSAFLDQDAYKDLQVGTQGEFGGLGIEVGAEDGFVKVVAPIEDTPAHRAGVQAGDLIIKLDGVSLKGMSLNDAVKRMRGKPHSEVTITVMRKGVPAPIDIKIRRDVIRVKSVKSRMIEPGYGMVRVTQFQEHTGENLVTAVNDLYKQSNGDLKGLVLDLRMNPGGLLNAAVAVSSAFLPKNALVVYTDGRTDDAKMRLTANKENYVRGTFREDYLARLPAAAKAVPLVVLVNGASASASEIVAGALQDHKRATVIGTQTFGKGSVQTILPLPNNQAVKLTTARYFTPNGRSIQAKGIVPDIVVEDATTDSRIFMREADLQHHLAGDGEKGKDDAAKPAETPVPVNPALTKPAPAKPAPAKPAPESKATATPDAAAAADGGKKEDVQLAAAMKFLKGLPITAAVAK
ncbi:MAG TPA: S41 family peptidase [Usitatibacteraceae bacterium]|nr:S41 family peptidase [Usitatibacteraceae bacterium]